jgi:hypothetical protein
VRYKGRRSRRGSEGMGVVGGRGLDFGGIAWGVAQVAW